MHIKFLFFTPCRIRYIWIHSLWHIQSHLITFVRKKAMLLVAKISTNVFILNIRELSVITLRLLLLVVAHVLLALRPSVITVKLILKFILLVCLVLSYFLLQLYIGLVLGIVGSHLEWLIWLSIISKHLHFLLVLNIWSHLSLLKLLITHYHFLFSLIDLVVNHWSIVGLFIWINWPRPRTSFQMQLFLLLFLFVCLLLLLILSSRNVICCIKERHLLLACSYRILFNRMSSILLRCFDRWPTLWKLGHS